MEETYVFGYGSLVDSEELSRFLGRESLQPEDYRFCRLHGYRRTWDVAMDNSIDLAGYKYYLSHETRKRPEVFVTFLNIRPEPDGVVNGILFRVTAEELERLRDRERNYAFTDVTGKLDVKVAGRVLTNEGTVDAVERYVQGLKEGRAVVSLEYAGSVERAFKGRGSEFYGQFLETTDQPLVPMERLVKISL